MPGAGVRTGLFLALLIAGMVMPSARAQTRDSIQADFWYGSAADGGPSVRLHYFYSPSCPHCQEAKPFLDALPSRYPWLEIVRYSVKDNPRNARFYFETGKQLGVEALSIPGFAFCGKLRIGFDTAATTGADLATELNDCRQLRMAALAPGGISPVPARQTPGTATTSGADQSVYVPLLGRVDGQRWSLPLLTLVLAGADAFNPCAFFVLLFLLSLLVHARSRLRMLLVGGTFVLFSGVIYFVFMAAWLNLFLLLGELRVVSMVAGVLALVVGMLNIKDYFAFQRGPTLSIPSAAKPGLFQRMRIIVAGGAIAPMIAGTVVLALVANSYELLCTAGFPMVFTRALTLANLQPWTRYAYLALYNFIYIVPLLAIVLIFTYTMGARKLSETEGRTLKLASGYMMAGFGLVLLAVPHLLTNVVASLAVLAAAIALTGLTSALNARLGASKQHS